MVSLSVAMAKVRYGSRVRSRWWLVTTVVVGLILVAAAGLAIWYVRGLHRPLVPMSIQSQLPFSPLVPTRGNGYQSSGFKYDATERIFSYKVTKGSYTVVVTEQTLPPQFTEVQGYQDQFLSGVVQQSSSVQTSNGTIYIGQTGKQSQPVGVLIGQSVLTFISPQGTNLSATQWRLLGEQLQIEKPN